MDSFTNIRSRVARLLGARLVGWTAVPGRTMAGRWIVRGEDGASVFVKAASDAGTARWLRAEHHLYAALAGEFMPRLLGWAEEDWPILVLEDLSGAQWPPPWSAARVDQVLAAMEAVRLSVVPDGLPTLEEQFGGRGSWRAVAADPAPFLSLGLCSPAWLEAALPDLIAAEAAAVLDGPELLHLDVRSDNLCFQGSRAVLVDWNWACRGNARLDIAAWLPSLHAEGGPAPETILPNEPELAALLCGYWACRAGLPAPKGTASVREVQLQQLRTALPWAARALSLPMPVSP